MNQAPENIEFLDPLAESEEVVDIEESFGVAIKRYMDGEIEHDYTADMLVEDVETMMLDATFQGQLEQANAMAQQMHVMCQHDHGLMDSASQSDLLSQHFGELGHEHGEHAHGDESDEEIDPLTGKKKKKRNQSG